MTTRPDFRRRGAATAILYALATWARDHGAQHVYLQVMDNNPPALHFFDRLGFTLCYRYYYRKGVRLTS